MEVGADPGWLSAVMAGVALSAASGLRVFLPLLALGLAVRLEWLEVGTGFAWLASDPVLLVLAIAAAFEILAFLVPWVDNLADVLASPAAVGSGILIVSSLLPEMSPAAQWSLAAVLGGGPAGIVQGASVLGRGASTAGSGGLANPLYGLLESAGSMLVIVLVFIIPVLAGLLVLLGLALIIGLLLSRRRRPEPGENPS